MWNLSGPGIKPTSPALAGGFLTTGPPVSLPLIFLSKNKRYTFHFHQELYRTVYLLFCSTTFCCFFQATSQFRLPKIVYLLEQKTVSGVFTVFQRIKIFSLREFYKDQDKWTSEKAMSDEYSG